MLRSAATPYRRKQSIMPTTISAESRCLQAVDAGIAPRASRRDATAKAIRLRLFKD
jgi:hypothetical protein